MRKWRVSALLLVALSFSAHAQAPHVRRELGAILLASRQALLSGDYATALSDLAAADDVADKTSDEVAVLEQMRVVAAIKASVPDVAAQSYQILSKSNHLTRLLELQYSQGIAAAYFAMGNGPGAATWAAFNIQLGGSDPTMQQLASAPAAAPTVYAIPPGVVLPSH